MSGRTRLLARAEARVQIVREAAGDREEPLFAGRPTVRDRGLEQMSGAVELVAVGEVRPAASRFRDLVVRVQVAVRALGGGDDVDGGPHVGHEPVARDRACS